MDDRTLVARMAAWMEAHLKDPVPGDTLAKVSGYSENRLRQKFYGIAGETPAGYLRKRRFTEAARAIIAGARIVDVAADYGYSSQENFTTAFKAWSGLNPGELRTVERRYRTLLSRMKEPLDVMELAKLKQEPLCTTQMGCVKGASDYFELDWTLPELFGFSGHAFMINIKADLCPSGPYVWRKDRFFLALRNLGIRRTGEIELRRGAPAADIAAAEARIKAHLDAGHVCTFDFLEHQLVAGYDAEGFRILQPWNGESGVELPLLSFGSWKEALDREGWAHFNLLEPDGMREDRQSLFRAALADALRVRTAPGDFALPGYAVGEGAWRAWIAGVEAGQGAGHGNWWNGMVWEECRTMAARFFDESAALVPEGRPAALCEGIAEGYRKVASLLATAKDKALPPGPKKAALEAGAEMEKEIEALVRELAGAIA